MKEYIRKEDIETIHEGCGIDKVISELPSICEADICIEFAEKLIKKLEDKAKDLKYWFDNDNLGLVKEEIGKILDEME